MSAIGRHVRKLSGYATTLPTPFDSEDRLDAAAFERLCELQIRHGATALVVGAATGEAPTLTVAEYRDLLSIAVRISRGRVPVIAGAGSNATPYAIELTHDAEANGADAILSVAPYYNKPTQDGLYAHFREIAGVTGLPIILCDDPARTVRGLADETIARLAELPQIIGLADAGGDAGRPSRLRPQVGADFRLLSGDDASALGFLAQGGDGCLSVASNLAPGLCRDMYLAWKHGNAARSRRLMTAIDRLCTALFCETDPAPLKYALSLVGLMSPGLRLPLVEPTAGHKTRIADIVGRMCGDYAGSMIGACAESAGRRRLAAAG